MIVPICPCKLSSQSNLTTATISRLPLYAQNYSSSQCSQSQNQSMNAPDIDPQHASFPRGNEINTSQSIPQSGPGQYTNQLLYAEPSTSLPESSSMPVNPSTQTTVEQSKTTLTSDIEQIVLTDIEQLKNANSEQLEKLIAGLLRQPNFISLLEKLDSLWKIKGLIG
ncbi:hypothetical protein Clacol_000551 [Clathrus columnatus]|uniref:Uncharacterized protein n=1 Tax=Clathrus columnatus TaxID=1419009 RepID=A0AAV4ZXB6_9AGAM|nr:hypothetical protein Clacol_000551 [Clathrus columnatus]